MVGMFVEQCALVLLLVGNIVQAAVTIDIRADRYTRDSRACTRKPLDVDRAVIVDINWSLATVTITGLAW